MNHCAARNLFLNQSDKKMDKDGDPHHTVDIFTRRGCPQENLRRLALGEHGERTHGVFLYDEPEQMPDFQISIRGDVQELLLKTQLRIDHGEKARKELARLKAEAEDKKKQLDEKQKKQQSNEKWYALIPYDGPNGTRRRPIYIECREDSILLQPEGIVLAGFFSTRTGRSRHSR